MLPNWVGDAAMATPALRALRKAFPKARLVGIARPYLIPLLDGTNWLDAILPWEHHGRGWWGRTCRLVREVRAERLDVLLLLRNSISSGMVARLSGAKRTIGFARNARRWLLTEAIPPPAGDPPGTPVSTVDEYLHIVEAIGCRPESRQLELATRPADETAADVIWQRLGLPSPDHVMLANVGQASGTARRWPDEYCVSLAIRGAEEFGLTTLVLCGPKEREAAEAIERAACDPRVVSMARHDVSFGVSKALIRRARLMVTTDSGPRHIAAAMNTPTIILSGPIDPRCNENYQADSLHLHVPLSCSPCRHRDCPLGHHRCMRELTVDRVLSAVGEMLERTRGRQAA
jgi:heptosyltransferase-2